MYCPLDTTDNDCFVCVSCDCFCLYSFVGIVCVGEVYLNQHRSILNSIERHPISWGVVVIVLMTFYLVLYFYFMSGYRFRFFWSYDLFFFIDMKKISCFFFVPLLVALHFSSISTFIHSAMQWVGYLNSNTVQSRNKHLNEFMYSWCAMQYRDIYMNNEKELYAVVVYCFALYLAYLLSQYRAHVKFFFD